MLFKKEIILQNQQETVVEYDGSSGVCAVVPNVDDLTFIKIFLDHNTLEWLQDLSTGGVNKLEDPLTRLIVWRSMFEMVRDAREIKSQDFVKLIFEHLRLEKNENVSSDLMLYLRSIKTYIPEQFMDEINETGFNIFLELLLKETDPDLVKSLKTEILGWVKSKTSVETVVQWYQGTHEQLKVFEPTITEKWTMMGIMIGSGQVEKELTDKLRKELEEEDTTDTKKEWSFILAAMTADDEEREKLWNSYYAKEPTLSYHMAARSMAGFNS